MIDENLVFIILITIFAVFIIKKQPYFVGTVSLIVIFYYLYKGRFTNPKEFFSFIVNKTQEAFEPCSNIGGSMAYCGEDTTTNSNMAFLPQIMRAAPVGNKINNQPSIVLKIEDYQVDRRLKFAGGVLTIDELIAAVPPLIDHKLLLEKIIKFIINVSTDDTIQKDYLARKCCGIMTKIFYNAYNAISDKKYPINTYNELLYAQREFDDNLNIFIFLAMNESDTKKLAELQKEFKIINDKLNEYVVEYVNDIMPNDYDITTSFLPHKDEPVGLSALDNYINL